MDWSLGISIVAIAVSVLTLVLTELQGPDIAIISRPKFEIDYVLMQQKRKEQLQGNLFGSIDTLLESNPAAFVFSNHGKKSGTILSIDLTFNPSEDFKKYYHTSEFKPTLLPQGLKTSIVNFPMTVGPGENTVFFEVAHVLTNHWKYKALYDNLDEKEKLPLQKLVEISVQKSYQEFTCFLTTLNKMNAIGTITCDLTYTKGRFRTQIRKKRLFYNKPLYSDPSKASAFFTEFLDRWEDESPSSKCLLDLVANQFELIMEELASNIQILNVEITDKNASNRQHISIERWRSMCNRGNSVMEITQWFLIKSEGLELKLSDLYANMERYNKLLNELDTRRRYLLSPDVYAKELKKVNELRYDLLKRTKVIENEMESAHSRRFK